MPTATKPDLSSIIHAYAFSTADKQRLATLLAQSYLLSKAQAYQKAVATTEHIARIRHPWTPGKTDVDKAQKWATEQVESIADTYAQAVQRIIEQVLQEQEEEPQRGLVGSLINVVSVAAGVKAGVQAFVSWKAPQITDYAWNKGGNDGTSEWIGDMLDGDVEWLDDDVAANTDRIQVSVLPATSSNDICATIAGQTFTLEEAAGLGIELPAHPNCPHYYEISVV